jgi:hypothetical protein
MVFCKELAANAETPDLFCRRCGGSPESAEEFGWLVFFQGMGLVVRANFAILPADCPVLFGVLDNIFWWVNHNE